MSLVNAPRVGSIIHNISLPNEEYLVEKVEPIEHGGYLIHLVNLTGQKWYLTDMNWEGTNWKMVTDEKKQIGGTHYTDLKIQPWEVIKANKMGFFDGTALKYIMRYRQKNGVEDLKKAVHTLEELISQIENTR